MKDSAKWALIAGAVIILGGAMTKLEFIIDKMAYAIRYFEGWEIDSRSYRNNNPGNLKYAGQKGAIGADNTGHAIFENYELGWAALKNQLRIAFLGISGVYSPSDTLYSFFAKYSEENQIPYARHVASELGVMPDMTLSQILSG